MSQKLLVRMVADVGGTNTRIALYNPNNNGYEALNTYTNRDYAAFESIVEHWLNGLDCDRPTQACIAVAAPLSSDKVAMTNIDWSFSKSALQQQFDFDALKVINDFESLAHALPFLGEADRTALFDTAKLSDKEPVTSGKLAVVGPGTGLGGATLNLDVVPSHCCPCEPGHMGLSPHNSLDIALFDQLLKDYDNIYAELLISGAGLARMYQCLANIHGAVVRDLTPAQVSSLALEHKDELATQTVQLFCAQLGSLCGSFAVATGSYSGLYLAGGIMPRLLTELKASEFYQRFLQKGAMGKHLKSVPIYLITHPQPGLIGAAHAPI